MATIEIKIVVEDDLGYGNVKSTIERQHTCGGEDDNRCCGGNVDECHARELATVIRQMQPCRIESFLANIVNDFEFDYIKPEEHSPEIDLAVSNFGIAASELLDAWKKHDDELSKKVADESSK